MKLALKALAALIGGFLFVGALVFLPAGTLFFPNAWLLCALLFVPMAIFGTVMLIKSPALLEKRLDSKEKENTQKAVIALSALMFVCGFIISGLDFRYGLTTVSTKSVIIASAVFLLGYLLYVETIRENAYISRTVKVEAGQKVVSSGLYGIVRHPMYFSTLLIFLSMPVILGSWISLAVFLLYIPIIVTRIICEEKLLERELCGYKEYKCKVKYRLIPFIW